MGFKSEKRKKGITIFFALIVISSLLVMTFFIVELARKEVVFSIYSRESQVAFYAAESGIECAWYWDEGGSDISPFWTGSGINNVNCGYDIIGPSQNFDGNYEFSFYIEEGGSHVEVLVDIENDDGERGKTTIISTGYNTSDEDVSRRFERRIELTYN